MLVCRLEAEMELKLMLYRHWSLYESMYHSNYVASRLQVRSPSHHTPYTGLTTRPEV